MKDSAKELFKKRFLVVTRPENLSEEAALFLENLLWEHTTLRLYRDFILDIYSIFAQTTPAGARQRRDEVMAVPAYCQNPFLARALKRLSEENFDKMIVYLGYENLNRTNNDAERAARNFRRQQNAHYRIRTTTNLENMMKHELMRQKAAHKTPPQKLQQKQTTTAVRKAA